MDEGPCCEGEQAGGGFGREAALCLGVFDAFGEAGDGGFAGGLEGWGALVAGDVSGEHEPEVVGVALGEGEVGLAEQVQGIASGGGVEGGVEFGAEEEEALLGDGGGDGDAVGEMSIRGGGTDAGAAGDGAEGECVEAFGLEDGEAGIDEGLA